MRSPVSPPSQSANACSESGGTPGPPPGKLWKVGTLVYTPATLLILFAWLLGGDFAWSMRDRSVQPMAQWYLTTLNVPGAVFGVLMVSFPALLGLVLGPIVSVRSDRHRGPRGRRIPYLLLTTPLAAAGMIGLGLTPVISVWIHSHFPETSEVLIALICFTLFWAVFEFATIAGQAVFGGLINDVVPQEVLGRFYGLFRSVALLDGMIFNFWLMGKVPTHFTLILVVIGLLYGVAFFLVCLRVREGEYPPPDALPPGKKRFIAGAGDYFRVSFGHPYYRSVFLMLMTAALTFVPVNTFSIPYAVSLGVNMEVYGHALALTYGISLVLAFPLGWLADKIHPLRLAMLALFGYALVSLYGSLFATTSESFLVSLVWHGVLSGCYFTGAASLPLRLFPHARFAQFSSAAGIVLSFGSIAISPLTGALIDAVGKDYRYTFAIGGLLAVSALLTAWSVYKRFNELGGTAGYQPPEPTPASQHHTTSYAKDP